MVKKIREFLSKFDVFFSIQIWIPIAFFFNVLFSLLLAFLLGSILGFFLAYPHIYYLAIREYYRGKKAEKQRAKDGWEGDRPLDEILKELAKFKEAPP